MVTFGLPEGLLREDSGSSDRICGVALVLDRGLLATFDSLRWPLGGPVGLLSQVMGRTLGELGILWVFL